MGLPAKYVHANMKTNPHRFLMIFISLLVAFSMAGCLLLNPPPTPTSTAAPTATRTLTPLPPSTATLAPVPTSSVNSQLAAPVNETCRLVIDGWNALTQDLETPEHFLSEDPARQPTDFDPNQYFQVFTNLNITPGYQLDYIYFRDQVGGKPLLYARSVDSAPFQTYEEFLQPYGDETPDEYSFEPLDHARNYLEQIQVDGSPESYFQFIILALLGDQFYLDWHGAYNDTMILCNSSDLARVDAEIADFPSDFSPEDISRIQTIELLPVVLVEEKTVTVRFVSFTKWGGFFENVFVMDKDNPVDLIDAQWNSLVEYDCGIVY